MPRRPPSRSLEPESGSRIDPLAPPIVGGNSPVGAFGKPFGALEKLSGKNWMTDSATRLKKGTKSPLFTRHPNNPILTAADWPYEINTVFNAGSILLEDGTTLL